MTDRYCFLTVALEKDIHEDNADCILDAIRMIKGVLDVVPHTDDGMAFTHRLRADKEWKEKIYELLK